MRLGPINWIVDYSYFKPCEFEQWYQSDSKSDVKTGFQFKDDVDFWFNWTNSLLKLISQISLKCLQKRYYKRHDFCRLAWYERPLVRNWVHCWYLWQHAKARRNLQTLTWLPLKGLVANRGQRYFKSFPCWVDNWCSS